MKLGRTTTEELYNIIKRRILHLEYKPGYALSALTLSEEMNVSRSPAREALIKLAADDLVEIFPQIGTRVSLINLNKVGEERFFTAINKPRCWTLMKNFGSNVFRLRLLSCRYIEKTPEMVIENHEDLLDAICKKELTGALEITHQHLSRISDEIPKLLEEYPEIFSMDNEDSGSRYQRNSTASETNFLDSI